MNLTILCASFLLAQPLLLLPSYISLGNSFPKPLSKKEEEEYLIRHEQGDPEAKNILIERNLRLVAHVAKKYNNTGKNTDDLISIGTIGLIKSINTYKRGKSVRLATYAARCIENEILMSIRNTKKTKVEVSLNEPIGMDKDGNQISFNDILGTDGDSIVDDLDRKILVIRLYEAMTRQLKPREQLVLIKRFGLYGEDEKTQREVARELDISRSYVSRIEKKAVEKLRKELEKDSL